MISTILHSATASILTSLAFTTIFYFQGSKTIKGINAAVPPPWTKKNKPWIIICKALLVINFHDIMTNGESQKDGLRFLSSLLLDEDANSNLEKWFLWRNRIILIIPYLNEN